MTFHFLDENMTRKILTSMITPKVIWSPHKKKHALKLEIIQRIATKMVTDLKDLPYKERLKEMQLSTLEERREREDLITIYKLTSFHSHIQIHIKPSFSANFTQC